MPNHIHAIILISTRDRAGVPGVGAQHTPQPEIVPPTKDGSLERSPADTPCAAPYSRGESSQRPWARLSAPSNRPLPNESTPSETNRARRSGSETITNTSSAGKTTSTAYADTSATTPPNGRMIKTTPRTSQSCPNTVVLPDRLTPRPTSVYPLRRRQSVDGFEPRSGAPHFCQTNSRQWLHPLIRSRDPLTDHPFSPRFCQTNSLARKPAWSYVVSRTSYLTTRRERAPQPQARLYTISIFLSRSFR